MGLGLGAGHAEAKIEPGHYVLQDVGYGFIPYPESNARVRGNTITQDYYGLGPDTQFPSYVVPTRNGGNVSAYGTSREAQWLQRVEYRKTRGGYAGTSYIYGGIPIGTTYLKDVPRRANQPR